MTSQRETADMLQGKRGSLLLWVGASLLLLLPLLAMQFSAEMRWDVGDFLLFGAMLAIACGSLQLALRKSRNLVYLTASGVAVATAFALVWVNLAVGIIGDESNRANLLFGGVLVVGVSAAMVAGFQPQRMARALLATALAQAVVVVIVLSLGWSYRSAIVAACFVLPWLVSAFLFRQAARQQDLANESQ